MNEIDNIKRLLIPSIKGLPIIIGLTLIAILLATKVIIYSVPMYQSFSLLRLDDKSTGLSGTNLYKDFDVFFAPQKIAAEVEVLKSGQLISRVADKLNYKVTYYRVGRVKRTELYTDLPFKVEFKHIASQYLDKEFLLEIKDSTSFRLGYSLQGFLTWVDGQFSKEIDEGVFNLKLNLHPQFNGKKRSKLSGEYVFIHHSKTKQIDLIKSNLFVKSVDKDVAVIRIGFKSQVPEKASEVANTVAKTYIENYIDIRTNAADKTGSFIEDRLDFVSEKLRKSERALEVYRSRNKIVNLRQQTETGLREASQVRVQYNNIVMQETALDSLNQYINQGNPNFLELAPQVAFGDLLFTELIKKMKTFQGERRELLMKYTSENEKVKVIEAKIEDLVVYLKESIKKTKQDMMIRRKELEIFLNKIDKQFDQLPTNEKQMVILEREFRLNQEMYNFLTQKRLEASIVKAATISFHQILEYGTPNFTAISPNKKLILFVSGLLGILISLAFIYLREFLSGKINSRSQLEKLTSLPIIGVIPKIHPKRGIHIDSNKFSGLASEFEVREYLEKGSTFLIGSSLPGEGKSYVAQHLAQAFQAKGKSVCLLDFNALKPEFLAKESNTWSEDLKAGRAINKNSIIKGENGVDILPGSCELSNLDRTVINALLKELKKQYDILIFDSAATVLGNESLLLYALVDHVIYLYRARFTGVKYAQQAEMLAEEYGWKNIHLLLNGVHPATNFSGYYTGSRYSYEYEKGNLLAKIKHYFKIYL
ncbi:hypothetical protein L3073_17920 [Ancylomarina sp. DW003]|nr:GNVR domain-containing protein [Ancylomarina sp. DW003]MDE5424095.1 hypothetical protein [Ancylomarina sp. DW003]